MLFILSEETATWLLPHFFTPQPAGRKRPRKISVVQGLSIQYDPILNIVAHATFFKTYMVVFFTSNFTTVYLLCSQFVLNVNCVCGDMFTPKNVCCSKCNLSKYPQHGILNTLYWFVVINTGFCSHLNPKPFSCFEILTPQVLNETYFKVLTVNSYKSSVLTPN